MIAVDVEVSGQQVGHHVELGVAARGHVDVVGDDEAVPACGRGGVGQPPAPHVVVVEQAVPVRAVHRAATQADVQPGRPRRAARPDRGGSRSPATERSPSAAGSSRRRTRCRRPAGRDPSTRRSPDSTGSSMVRHSIWKPPQMPSTGPARRRHARRPPSASPRSRSHARSDTVALLPGSTTTSASARSAASVDPPHQHPRLAGQRLDVGGVRDARQPDRRHPSASRRRAAGCGTPDDPLGLHGQRVLGVQPQTVVVRDDAVGRPARSARSQLVQPRLPAGRGRRGTC